MRVFRNAHEVRDESEGEQVSEMRICRPGVPGQRKRQYISRKGFLAL